MTTINITGAGLSRATANPEIRLSPAIVGWSMALLALAIGFMEGWSMA